MPRLFFIAVLLVGVAGCGSERHAFTGFPLGVAPIANTESYYAVILEDQDAVVGGRTIVRVEHDGSVHTIRWIDDSYDLEWQIATAGEVVMKVENKAPRMLYQVATGELSSLPEGYKWTDGYWPEIKEKMLDSLKKEPPLREISVYRILSIYSPDHYLVEAAAPPDEGNVSKKKVSGFSGDSFPPGCFAPSTYWLIADMKRKTTTKVCDDARLHFSSSRKNILFTYGAEDGKEYAHVVHLEDYVK